MLRALARYNFVWKSFRSSTGKFYSLHISGSLGLSGLGSIGSERAAAAQQNHQQFSPWRGVPPPLSNLVPTSTPATNNMNGPAANNMSVERQMYRNNMPPNHHVEQQHLNQQHRQQQHQQQQMNNAPTGGHMNAGINHAVNERQHQQQQNNNQGGSYNNNMPMVSVSFKL